jgi:hypothetical protein
VQLARPLSGRSERGHSNGRYSPPLLAAWHGAQTARPARAGSAGTQRRRPGALLLQHSVNNAAASPLASPVSPSGAFVRRVVNPQATLRFLSLAADAAAAIEVMQRQERLQQTIYDMQEAKEHVPMQSHSHREQWPNPASSPRSANHPASVLVQPVTWTRLGQPVAAHLPSQSTAAAASAPSSPAMRAQPPQYFAAAALSLSARGRVGFSSRMEASHRQAMTARADEPALSISTNHPHAVVLQQQQHAASAVASSVPALAPHRPPGSMPQPPIFAVAHPLPRAPGSFAAHVDTSHTLGPTAVVRRPPRPLSAHGQRGRVATLVTTAPVCLNRRG